MSCAQGWFPSDTKVLNFFSFVGVISTFTAHPRPDEESESTEWETDTDASDEEEGDGEQARATLAYLFARMLSLHHDYPDASLCIVWYEPLSIYDARNAHL